MREVEFTKAFANKEKGDRAKFDGLLASQLVRKDKVAKYVDVKEKKTTKKK